LKTIALITAGGKGQRMQSSTAKQFLLLGGKPILARTIAVFEACPVVDAIFVIAPQDEMAMVQTDIVEKYQYKKVLKVVRGGRMRQQSVWNGLRAIKSDCSWVVVHDGVRPLITPQLIEAGIREARQTGAAIVAVPARDTVKRLAPGGKLQTLPREEIWLAQTPQIFEFSLLCRAHQKANQEKFRGTDEASLVERLGQAISLIPGDYGNIKITTPEDLTIAETLITKGRKGL
jgi:2-C-methyl-D-erythritol 4-phosphate cytidylyltransferase